MKKMRRIYLPNRYLMMICIISLWTFPAWAQTTVTGTVKDAGGNSLPGVTVQLKGTTVATTTTNNGTFNISAPLTGTLVFSMIGYGSQEQNINNRSSLNVTLESESELVEEVVVVGYNVVKKSDLTRSVVSINSEDITAMPVKNPLQALQGGAAGLDVTSNERPVEMGSIRVRGERSLLASNSPLYVVDGVPLSSGGIEFLNPKDIETLDVLKDASATAIYGSRGANGVIIVTTKRGVSGKTMLNYSVTSTIEKLNDRMEMMDATQYIDFRREAYRNAFRQNTNDDVKYPEGIDYDKDMEIFGKDPYAWANIEKGWVNGQWNGSLVPTTDWGNY